MDATQRTMMANFAMRMLLNELGRIELSGSDDFERAFELLDKVVFYS